MKSSIKKLYQGRKFFLPIIIIPIIVIIVALFKFSSSEDDILYARVKVSQGLWWASTANPEIWLANSIKKGDIEQNLLGKTIAEVLEIRRYPIYTNIQAPEDKFNIYLQVKLQTNKNDSTQIYMFKRSGAIVGSPIQFEFNSAQVSGTIMEISPEPFNDNYQEVTIDFVSKESYIQDYPYLYDNIFIGDTYHDGEEVVFEVLDKSLTRTISDVPDLNARLFQRTSSTTQNIVVKARVKARERDGILVFGEEKILNVSNPIIVTTPKFNFRGFIIGHIYPPENSENSSL